MENQEINRHHYNHNQYRCQKLTCPHPKEKIQQTNLKQIINKVTKAKTNSIMRGRF